MVNRAETLQEKLFREVEQKDLFRMAQQHAFEYVDALSSRAVYPQADALDGLAAFDEALPDGTGSATEVLDLLNRHGSPATVAQTGGRYFGFVNGGALPVGLAARWLSDFWDQNAALDTMSPVSSKLEEVCESWLVTLFGLPTGTVAGFVGGSSAAILCGLAAARYRILGNRGWSINESGLDGAPRIRIVCSDQVHAAVTRAVALLGFGTRSIEWVDSDAQGRIIPSAIPTLDESAIVIVQAGNVCSGAFDGIDEVCERAQKAKAWVHIDGAFGLWAAASRQLRYLTRGLEKATSLSVDAHKTLNAPYDAGIALCTDREALKHALLASGSYVAYGNGRNGMQYTPDLSRRARAVELWAVLKYLGKDGIDQLVTGLHERAIRLKRGLEAKGFRILNDVVFNQVLVACGSATLTERTLRQVQESGECWVGGAVWQGEPVIRVSICSWATTEDDIDRSVEALASARMKAAGEAH